MKIQGLEKFWHAEVLFLFDRVDPKQVVRGAWHLRNEAAWSHELMRRYWDRP